MTTEQDFQHWLDENLLDFTTRLVFADWLDERDDPRAAGYRALGLLRCAPMRHHLSGTWCWMETDTGKSVGATLRSRWYSKLSGRTFESRQSAENGAALAWGRMTEEQQQLTMRG